MIVSKEKRIEKLLEAGVPFEFLDGLRKIENYGDLQFLIREPDSFYFYIQDVYENYTIIKDFNIVPVYEGSNGDVFYAYLYNETERKFIHFELENDAIYSDYGTSFDLMLANLLIDFYEFSELSIAELIKKGESLGAKFANELFKELVKADEKNLRSTFELDSRWRNDKLKTILKIANKN